LKVEAFRKIEIITRFERTVIPREGVESHVSLVAAPDALPK
jgi:hypothetical protein